MLEFGVSGIVEQVEEVNRAGLSEDEGMVFDLATPIFYDDSTEISRCTKDLSSGDGFRRVRNRIWTWIGVRLIEFHSKWEAVQILVDIYGLCDRTVRSIQSLIC